MHPCAVPVRSRPPCHRWRARPGGGSVVVNTCRGRRPRPHRRPKTGGRAHPGCAPQAPPWMEVPLAGAACPGLGLGHAGRGAIAPLCQQSGRWASVTQWLLWHWAETASTTGACAAGGHCDPMAPVWFTLPLCPAGVLGRQAALRSHLAWPASAHMRR